MSEQRDPFVDPFTERIQIERPEPGTVRPALRKPMLVVVLVLLVAVVGFASTRHGPFADGSPSGPVAVVDPSLPPAAPASPEPSATADIDWTEIVTQLDAARIAVFSDPSHSSLVDVDRPGSNAFRADDAIRALLTQRQLHAHGMRFTLRSVRLVAKDGATVTLELDDELAAYEIVDAHDTVVERRPARGLKTWEATLRRDEGKWRFTDLAPSSTKSP